MEIASTIFSRLRTVRTPLRNSAELICERWQNNARSMNTTSAVEAASRMSQMTGPPLAKSVGNMSLLYGSPRKVQSVKIGKPPSRQARPDFYLKRKKNLGVPGGLAGKLAAWKIPTNYANSFGCKKPSN